MEKSEIEKLKIGDTVRCLCSASKYHNHIGKIIAIRPSDLDIVFDVDGTRGGWLANHNLELVSRATPAEAKSEAWVPKVGDRVRFATENLGSLSGKLGTVKRVEAPYADWHMDGGNLIRGAHFDHLEPAPSAPAKAEFPTRAADLDLRRKPAPSAPAKAKERPMCRFGYHDFGNTETDDVECAECGHARGEIESRQSGTAVRTWDSDKYNGIVKSDLDARIAAAKQEMQLTTAQRRSRLGPSDARERDLGMAWQTACWEDVG